MIEIEHLVGKVADDEAFSTCAIIVCGINTHCAGCDSAFVKGDPSDHPPFDESAVPVVSIEFIGLRVIRFEDVGQSVGIVIKDANAERFAGVILNACAAGDIGKCPIPSISEEFAGLSCIGFRGTVGFTDAVERTEQVILYTPFNVVCDIEIEMPVVVVVEPCATRAETGDYGYRLPLSYP